MTSLIQVERKIFIPLFFVKLEEIFETKFDKPKFVPPVTFHTIEEQTPPLEVSDAVFEIKLFPFNGQDLAQLESFNDCFPVKSLEQGYDKFYFDRAQSAILFTITESYTQAPGVDILIKTNNSLYEHDLISAFLRALKLYDDTEPHYLRGYHSKNGELLSMQTWWPLKEMQGTQMEINHKDFDEIICLSNLIWELNSKHRESTASRIFNLAVFYFLLSATQTEYNVIFIFLMIAFEALFKESDEESVSRAKARFGKLIAETKAEYTEISKFISEDPSEQGCCFLRNAIVHNIRSETFWTLKKYIRRGLRRVLEVISTGEVDLHNYYCSLDTYVETRFSGLPTK